MSLSLTPVDFFSLPPRDMNNVNIMWGHFSIVCSIVLHLMGVTILDQNSISEPLTISIDHQPNQL